MQETRKREIRIKADSFRANCKIGRYGIIDLFKDKDTARIASVRSSRHYFLDYAMENDAIYTHYGWSPQAESDIASYRINNINGMLEYNNFFKKSIIIF